MSAPGAQVNIIKNEPQLIKKKIVGILQATFWQHELSGQEFTDRYSGISRTLHFIHKMAAIHWK